MVTTIGGLLSGIIVYGLAPEAEGHGTTWHRCLSQQKRRNPNKNTIGQACRLSNNNRLGRKRRQRGPNRAEGAGFGSFLSRRLHLSLHDKRIAVAVGIGAGIGAIFKAPFGGAILSAEILYMGDFEAETLLPAFIASTVGIVYLLPSLDGRPYLAI